MTDKSQLKLFNYVEEKNKELKPSPNMKVLVSNSAQLELRVTHPNIDKNILSEFLNGVSDTYIISEEISKKKVVHFHCLVCNLHKKVDNDIEKFREIFKEKFPFLNSGHMYNLAIIKNEDKYISYILKEHDSLESDKLVLKGVNQEFLLSMFVYKYKKFDKRRFVEEMESIEMEYIKRYVTIKPMKDWELLKALCEVRIKYNQTINWPYMCQYTEKIICKCDPDYLKQRCIQKWEDYNYIRSNYKN